MRKKGNDEGRSEAVEELREGGGARVPQAGTRRAALSPVSAGPWCTGCCCRCALGGMQVRSAPSSHRDHLLERREQGACAGRACRGEQGRPERAQSGDVVSRGVHPDCEGDPTAAGKAVGLGRAANPACLEKERPTAVEPEQVIQAAGDGADLRGAGAAALSGAGGGLRAPARHAPPPRPAPICAVQLLLRGGSSQAMVVVPICPACS